jgi:hypothetical protein
MRLREKHKLCCVAAGLLLAATVTPVLAQERTNDVRIVRLGTGWGSDTFHLTVDQPVINPGSCPTTDGYATELTKPGYKTHYAAALLAFSMKKRVTIAVSSAPGDCVHSRPAIIGISIAQD